MWKMKPRCAGVAAITTIGLLGALAGAASADEICVPADHPTIQAAIDAASDGDEVVVAAGTYNEAIDLLGKAIVVRSAEGAAATIIDASGLGDAVSAVSCVSGEAADTTLEGFTITGGTGTLIGASGIGGGMINVESSPTVIGCAFIANAVSGSGGGMYNDDAHPTVSNCVFEDNSAFSGAGMSNHYGSTPTLVDCRFVGNVAAADGGGMSNVDVASPSVINTSFVGNQAGGAGGGANNHNFTQASFINCIFVGNVAANGGGMSVVHDDAPSVLNCTFYGNEATQSGGGLWSFAGIGSWYPTIRGSILWGNQPEQVDEFQWAPPTVVTSSNVQGGWPGANNIDIEPLFVDPDGADNIIGTSDDNVRLMPGSPAIDAGDNSALPPEITTDFDGNPRFVDDPATPDNGLGTPPIVDMGAYEFQPTLAAPGDINGDGVVDMNDVPAFTGVLLGADTDPARMSAADLNGDGSADGADVRAFVDALIVS